MKYHIYIIYSIKNDRYYVGYTSDIENRLNAHNSGKNKSTQTGRPWILKYVEYFDDELKAKHREIEIKKKKSHESIKRSMTSIIFL